MSQQNHFVSFTGKVVKVEQPSFSYRVAGTQRHVYEFDVKHFPNLQAEDYLFCRVRACSADVPNRNGDAFPYDELKSAYHTFIGKGVYTNHDTDGVEKIKGIILDATFKEDQTHGAWVELLVAVDRANEDLCRMILKGQVTDVSMGCIVPRAGCSICGNICQNKQDEYGNLIDQCEHIAHYKGGTYNGEKVFENCYDVEFVEISWVTDGADEEAFALDIDIAAVDVPDNVVSVIQAGQSANKKVAMTKRTAFTLVSELDEEDGNEVFELAAQVAPEDYWSVYSSLQNYTMAEAVSYLNQLARGGAEEPQDNRVSASYRHTVTQQDTDLLKDFATEYLYNYMPESPDATSVYSLSDYLFGHLEEYLKGKSLEAPIEIDDPNGIIDDVARTLLENHKKLMAQTKLTRRIAKSAVKLNDLTVGQGVVVSDKEYQIDQEKGVVRNIISVDPITGIVDCVEIMLNATDSRRLVKIFQDDLTAGISKLEI
mgnify:CR=1 FL=1